MFGSIIFKASPPTFNKLPVEAKGDDEEAYAVQINFIPQIVLPPEHMFRWMEEKSHLFFLVIYFILLSLSKNLLRAFLTSLKIKTRKKA